MLSIYGKLFVNLEKLFLLNTMLLTQLLINGITDFLIFLQLNRLKTM